jgi:DNA replication protein DnaC
LFFLLVSRRYERASLLITTNQPSPKCGHVFRDEMIAATVLDRVLHHRHLLVIQDSYRLRRKLRAGLLGSGK